MTEPGLSAPPEDAVRRIEHDGLPPYYTFPLLEATERIVCAFTTRLGGVSEAPFNTLNLGLTTKDAAANVRENRERMRRAVGFPWLDWIRLEHGNRVHLVDGFPGDPTETPLGDALITSCPRLPLTIYYADCVPIVFLDADRPAIGVAHAGWRGTVDDVAAATVVAMQTHFGTDARRLLCGLGSSIGPCCFEVDDDVASVVRSRFPLWQDSVVGVRNNQKSSIDLWSLNKLQLERAGVPRQNIAISRLCTACRPDLFFSYRRDRKATGRLAMLVALR